MRNKRILAAVSTLALGGVVTTGALATASAAPAAASHTRVATRAGAPSSDKILGVSAALGKLLAAVGKVTDAAKAKPVPSAAALQPLLKEVQQAAQALQKAAAGQHMRVVPATGERAAAGLLPPAAAPLPAAGALHQALARLDADLAALVKAITSGKAAEITGALGKVAQDLLAVLRAAVTGLAGAGLQSGHH